MLRFTLHEHIMTALPILFAVGCGRAWNTMHPHATSWESFDALFPAFMVGLVFTWVVSAVIAYTRQMEQS